jgi:hypothetical protein
MPHYSSSPILLAPSIPHHFILISYPFTVLEEYWFSNRFPNFLSNLSSLPFFIAEILHLFSDFFELQEGRFMKGERGMKLSKGISNSRKYLLDED